MLCAWTTSALLFVAVAAPVPPVLSEHHVPQGTAPAVPAFPPPPPSNPFLYFGANGTGPVDSPTYLSLASNGSLAGYGWQANAAPSNYTHGELNLKDAAAALSAAAPALPVFVYRHFQMGWRLFDVQRAADDNPALKGLFLKDNDNSPSGAQCRQQIPGGGTAPLYAFVNASAGAFWVDSVVKELANEPSFVSAVFFDECDWSACGYSFAKDGCMNISDAFRAKDLMAKLPAIRATADALGLAGKWPIFSSKNLLEAAWEGLPGSAKRPCVIPHDAFFAALAGKGAARGSYGRFYEFWMGQGPALDAATIANALLEGGAGVGLVARASAGADAQCDGGGVVCPQGSVGKTPLTYALAAFLVARTSPYSYFGVSAGWYSQCWCWHGEYDLVGRCGEEKGPAQRTSPYSWSRAFQGCDVTVNTTSQVGTFLMHH